MRQKIFHLLKGTPIHLVALNRSKFYHIGSVRELIRNFCADSWLRSELGLRRFVSSKLVGEGKGGAINGVIMQSIINRNSQIHHEAVLEYCEFQLPIFVGKNSLISNCSTTSNHSTMRSLVLPDNCLFHTIPISEDHKKRHVTIAFSSTDDLKSESKDGLTYFGMPLLEVLHRLRIHPEKEFSSNKRSLWNAKLFSAKPTMDESFLCALDLVKFVTGSGSECVVEAQDRFSMEDVLAVKDYEAVLHRRKQIRLLIS